jgi:hypothetical protein
MPDTGCRMPDARYRMPDTGCQIPDARCRIDVAGCNLQGRNKMNIKEVLIQSSRLKELKEFYQSVLELTIESRGNDSIAIGMGRSSLIIEGTNIGSPFYHFAINIPANKIEEARSWLFNKVELLWMEDYKNDIADFRNWHAKSIYFFDPVGNIVELIARFDLGNGSNEKFSSEQFLSISEIGLVFPEIGIEQQTKKIIEECELPYFLKQPPMQHFKVLGDDEGLFIIVPENRNWYPTNKPSGIYPLEITFESAAAVHLMRI